MEVLVGFSLLFVLILHVSVAQLEPIVTVSNGDILGTEISHDGRDIDVYKGIPYAKPPIGPLRFKKPEPAESWQADGILNATRYGPSCTQFANLFDIGDLENLEISEDCLTLNVFVPSDSSESSLAIMVWIHGGGFFVGQGQFYDPRDMVAKGDVIVVTINYRLGPFGFLSTEDENAPGNFGLWDQLLAIEWVRDNAAAFGGDQHRITIFGESAGAWSVSILVLSPKSQGVFQRAISQSGAMMDDLLQASPITEARALADRLNCTEEDTALLVECLRGVSEGDIVSFTGFSIWSVVVDGDLLPDLPSKLVDIGNLDYMLGFNELEGFVLTIGRTDILNNTASTNQGISQASLEMNIDNTLTYSLPSLTDDSYELRKVIEAATFAYTHWEDLDNDQERLLNLIRFTGDVYFVAPSVQLANQHRSAGGSGATYLYYFTYKSSNPALPLLSSSYSPPWNDKATHADELEFMFFFPDAIPFFNEADKNVSETIITYWTNFARTGDPNESNDNTLPEWKQYGEEGEYIELGEVAVSGQDMTDLDPEHLSFWLELVPNVIGDSCPSDMPLDTTTTFEPCTETADVSKKNSFALTAKESEVVIWVLLGVVVIMFLLTIVLCLSYINRKTMETYVES